jgi:hypothetical protein
MGSNLGCTNVSKSGSIVVLMDMRPIGSPETSVNNYEPTNNMVTIQKTGKSVNNLAQQHWLCYLGYYLKTLSVQTLLKRETKFHISVKQKLKLQLDIPQSLRYCVRDMKTKSPAWWAQRRLNLFLFSSVMQLHLQLYCFIMWRYLSRRDVTDVHYQRVWS